MSTKRKYEDDNDSDIEEVYSNVRVRKNDSEDDLIREVFDSGKISREADQGDVEVIEDSKNGEINNIDEDDEEEDDDPEEEDEDDDPEEKEADDPDLDPDPEEEEEEDIDDDEKENVAADEDVGEDEDEEEEDLARIRKGNQGDCPITPFNMKEEMEEGHFDEEGTYHWKKEKLVRDNWLENIDWVKVKNGEGAENKLVSDDTIDSTESFDCIAVYKKILLFLKPKDTIASAIRRLGGNKTVSTAEKWKRKKAGESTNEDTAALQKVTDLTELANLVLNKTGNMDIYQETYEKIVEKISKPNEKFKGITEPCKAPELDMYADDFGDKEKARLEGESAAKKQTVTNQSSDNEPTSSSDISSTTSSTYQKSFSIGEAGDGCDSAEVEDVMDNSNTSP